VRRELAKWIVAGVILAAVAAGVSFPQHGPQRKGCQLVSALQMHQIARAAALYAQDNGTLPERLAQLVPDYAATPKLFYFTCRYGTTFKPPDAETNPELIDAFSPYSLLSLGNGRAVVFERLPMWSDETIGFQLLTSKGATDPPRDHRLPRGEFARRYLQGFKQ
jgi:hypothetical protein